MRGARRANARMGRKKDGMHTPLFVAIDKPWRHSADVRTCTNKQENDEKEGLEVEQGGLRSELVAVKESTFRSNYKTQDRKETRTMAVFESYDQLPSSD